MKRITTTIKDDDMIAYVEAQRVRYGSYSAFMRSLIIDRMDNTRYRRVDTEMYTKENIDKIKKGKEISQDSRTNEQKLADASKATMLDELKEVFKEV